jgi:hypothetical protein
VLRIAGYELLGAGFGFRAEIFGDTGRHLSSATDT